VYGERDLGTVMQQHISWVESGNGPRSPMSLPALYAVVRLIASTIDQLQLTTTTGVLPNRIADPRAWGSTMDLGDHLQHVVTSMATRGAGYSLATPVLDSDGTLRWLLDPLHPDSVQARVSTSGVVRIDYLLDGQPIDPVPATQPGRSALLDLLRRAKNDPGRVQVPAYIVPCPYLVTPEHPEGSTPVREAWESIQGYLDVERQSSNLLKGGTYSGGILETDHDITAETAKRYQTAWQESAKLGRVKVLGGGLRYRSEIISPKEASWLDSRLFDMQSVCAMFGVPPDLVGMAQAGNGSLSYQNRQDNLRSFASSSLQAFTSQISDAWSVLLPPGQRFIFDYTEWEAASDADAANATGPAADPAD